MTAAAEDRSLRVLLVEDDPDVSAFLRGRLEADGLTVTTLTDGAVAVVEIVRSAPDVVLLVDIANVMGSRPDGWWRDRSGAAVRLMALLPPVTGAEVALPDQRGPVRIAGIRAVVEGAARRAEGPPSVTVLRAEHDGDSEIVAEADIDGALVGGASLDPDEFTQLCAITAGGPLP